MGAPEMSEHILGKHTVSFLCPFTRCNFLLNGENNIIILAQQLVDHHNVYIDKIDRDLLAVSI